MHALVEFLVHWPNKTDLWYRESNHLCFLSLPDEDSLKALISRLRESNVLCVPFREPDFDMSLTAVAIEATNQARELVRDLPLALK